MPQYAGYMLHMGHVLKTIDANFLYPINRELKRSRKHTEINLAPIHRRVGEGNGSNRRPTPYIATEKKWRTKLIGRGLRPESRATGPVEQTPPRLR